MVSIHLKKARIHVRTETIVHATVIRVPQTKSCLERRAMRNRALSEQEQRRNRRNGAIRCRVEHVFGVIKHIFGWRTV